MSGQPPSSSGQGPMFTPGSYGQQPSGMPTYSPPPGLNVQPQFHMFQQGQTPPGMPSPNTVIPANVGAPHGQYSSHGHGAPRPGPVYMPPQPVFPQQAQLGQGPQPPAPQQPGPPQTQQLQIPQNAIIPGSQADQLIQTLLNNLQAQAEKLQQLELQYNGIMGRMSGPDLRVKFPAQLKAGVIEYPDLLPYPFFYGLFELTEGANSLPFGTTANISSVDINLDTIYTYFTNVDFYQIRTARPDGSNDVLFSWLPRSAVNSPYLPAGGAYQGFDFLFDIKAVSNGINWSSGQMPSAILDMQLGSGWQLPIEYHAKNKDTIRISAQPLQAAPQDYEYRLFTGIWGYQLRSRRG